jgi:hygromycin-B 7''-O-kinase
LNHQGICFRELLKNEDLCFELVSSIAREKNVPLPKTRIRQGSNILFQLGDGSIIKVFSRDEAEFRNNESLFLRNLHGRLPVNTPRLETSGEYGDYPYIVMSKLDGSPLSDVWDDLGREDRMRICEQIGHLLRELHQLPADIADGCVPEWSTFINEQKEYLIDNHLAYGIVASRLGEISRFVRLGKAVEETAPLVVCHTEIMREHLFVTMTDGEPNLSGLLDFEPSMLAVPQYELCAAGLFVTAGDSELFGRLLNAYGEPDLTDPMDITRMLILHRYSNLTWFISLLPEKLHEADIRTLGRFWYGSS